MNFKAFIGIDISKLTLDIAILNPEKKTISHRKIDNNEEGFKQLVDMVNEKDASLIQHVMFCMEHTGVYGKPLCSFLSKNQLSYTLQTPLHIKQSMGMRRLKNDKTDAEMLAKYAYLHKEEIKLTNAPPKLLSHIRDLIVYRDRLVKIKVQLEVGIKDFSEFTDKETQLPILRNSNKNIEQISESIKEIEKQIAAAIKSSQEVKEIYNLIVSIPGIGLLIAANLITYTNCFHNFDSWRKFSCYCGVAPFERSSGTSLRLKPKISNMGSRKLKSLLGLAAISAVNYDTEMRAYYSRKIKEGKEKKVVLNAIKNKLISRVFATIKRGTPYVKIQQPIIAS